MQAWGERKNVFHVFLSGREHGLLLPFFVRFPMPREPCGNPFGFRSCLFAPCSRLAYN